MNEYFYNELLPVALLTGMTPEQFWYDEPRLLDSYIKKRELELDAMNYNSWLIGFYVQYGIDKVIASAFGSKNVEGYFNKPLEDFNSTKKQVVKTKEEVEDKSKQQFNFWAKLSKKGGKK